ncbi:MAG TPA: hypothetical protein EYP85_06880, partial [Armatimonadetes bacterium]|nr:hypothetical protein [Armatimonadota bacterium]
MFHRLLGALPTAVFVGGLTMAAWAAARNLVANPSFEKVEKAKVGEPREVPTEWRFYVIVMPAADRADTSTAHTGKTSFHFSLGEKAKAF